jgi:hypothetical protein
MFFYLKNEKKNEPKRIENKIHKNLSVKIFVETFTQQNANISKKAYILTYNSLNQKSVQKYSQTMLVKPVKFFIPFDLNLNSIRQSLKNFPIICLVRWSIHNSLLIFQNHHSLECSFEFFFFEFLKSIENTYFLENLKKKVFPPRAKVRKKSVMKKRRGSLSKLVKNKFLSISKDFKESKISTKFNKPFIEMDLELYKLFSEYRFKMFKSFTIKNWMWARFDFYKKYQTKPTNRMNENRHNYFNGFYSDFESFDQLDKTKFKVLNLLNFFKYDTNERIYKNTVSSKATNYDLLEKILLFDINIKKSFLLKVTLLFCFICKKTNFFYLFSRPIKNSFLKYVLNFDDLKNLKKKKFVDILIKAYFYKGFSFFFKKLFFLKIKNVGVSDFKSANCQPFLAVEKRIHFFLEQNSNVDFLNFNPINFKLVNIEKDKNKFVSLGYFLLHLINVNNQSVSFYSYTALYDFLVTASRFKQKFSTMNPNPNSLILNISNIPISLLEKTLYRTIEKEFVNHSISRFFFDYFMRINFFYASKSTQPDHQIVHFKTSLTTSYRVLRSFKKVNRFFFESVTRQNLLNKIKKINLFFVPFQKSTLLRMEFCLYLYCLKKNVFLLIFLKTFIFEKNFNFMLKEFKVWLKNKDFDFCISNLYSYPLKKTHSRAFFPKKSCEFLMEFIASAKLLREKNPKFVYATKLQFLYNIYTVHLLTNKNFGIFLEKEEIVNYVNQLKRFIKSASMQSQYLLIKTLSSKIYAWCYTYRFISTEKLFFYLDFQLFNFLWRWAYKRHDNKNRKWIFLKYFYFFEKKKYIFGILLKTSNKLSIPFSSKHVNLNFFKSHNCLPVSPNSQKFIFVYLPFPSQVFKNLNSAV